MSQTSNNGFLFPLWLHGAAPDDLLETSTKASKANISPEYLAAAEMVAGRASGPEDVLAWIYAVLYTPSYRTRYDDFLRRDFPHPAHHRPRAVRRNGGHRP